MQTFLLLFSYRQHIFFFLLLSRVILWLAFLAVCLWCVWALIFGFIYLLWGFLSVLNCIAVTKFRIFSHYFFKCFFQPTIFPFFLLGLFGIKWKTFLSTNRPLYLSLIFLIYSFFLLLLVQNEYFLLLYLWVYRLFCHLHWANPPKVFSLFKHFSYYIFQC